MHWLLLLLLSEARGENYFLYEHHVQSGMCHCNFHSSNKLRPSVCVHFNKAISAESILMYWDSDVVADCFVAVLSQNLKGARILPACMHQNAL